MPIGITNPGFRTVLPRIDAAYRQESISAPQQRKRIGAEAVRDVDRKKVAMS
jgi:hypothetical protein